VRIKLEELNPKTEKINGSTQHGRERKPKINPEILETLSITIGSYSMRYVSLNNFIAFYLRRDVAVLRLYYRIATQQNQQRSR